MTVIDVTEQDFERDPFSKLASTGRSHILILAERGQPGEACTRGDHENHREQRKLCIKKQAVVCRDQ